MKPEKVLVYNIVSNTDLVEGRGKDIVLGCTENEITARRFAKGRGVMGCSALVTKSVAYRIDGQMYYSHEHLEPTELDTKKAEIIASIRKTITKLRSLGISETSIKDLIIHGEEIVDEL